MSDANGMSCNLRVEARRGHVVVWPEATARPDDAWFEPQALIDAGRAEPGGTGRGATLRFEADGRTLLLRHYRRGGLAQRFSDDCYLRLGLRNSRPWRELALLTRLHAGGMAVPAPVAARVSPVGALSPWYRGDLITAYLAGTRTLAQGLHKGRLERDAWARIGETIAGFHAVGVDHADLNAHNVLLGSGGEVFLIDFDRARLRRPGRWRQRNLERLRRSLDKLVAADTAIRAGDREWQRLLAGYRSG